MLTKTEQVWRHLLVASYELGKRRHPSVTAIAGELGFGVSTVHKALQRPAGMGAVHIKGGGGVRVIDSGRFLLLWAGNRDLRGDLLEEIPIDLPAPEVERLLPAARLVLGGFGAVVAGQGGNHISGYDHVLCYGDPGDIPSAVRRARPGDTVVMVLEPDPLLRRYGNTTPLPQAYVDLFNLPGWPAARFVSALNSEMLELGAAPRSGAC